MYCEQASPFRRQRDSRLEQHDGPYVVPHVAPHVAGLKAGLVCRMANYKNLVLSVAYSGET